MLNRNHGGRLPGGAPNKIPEEMRVIPTSIAFPLEIRATLDALPSIQKRKISRSRLVSAIVAQRLGLQDPEYSESDIDLILGKLYG